MTALVYLMRHGIAEDPSAGVDDAGRALTREGLRKTVRVVAGLKEIDVRPDLILSSPLRRAVDTAQIAAETLTPEAAVEIFPPLVSGGTAAAVVAGLRRYRGARALLLVGHQPDLGELASYLLTGSTTVVPLPFRKAGVAAITVDALPPETAGVLEWFLTPGQLKAIAASLD